MVNLKNHQKLDFHNYELYFPYEPYNVQNEYMDKVVKAIWEGENALLESPTGTGKTLCLLAASISALKKERESDPTKVWDKSGEEIRSKIIYTSRTFSQLT